MNRFFRRLGGFYRNMRVCMASANQDCDTWYHIPKSRFRDNGGEEGAVKNSTPVRKIPPRNYFLGSFRDCLLEAWRASDKDYNIPKSRFQDLDFNQTAYRSKSEPGFWSRVGGFIHNVRHCLSISWEASDTFYHLPRSRYQDADFIRDLMKLAPEAAGKLLYRPYTIGRIVVDEENGKGWSVKPPVVKREDEEVFFIPPVMTGPDREPEVEM